MDRHDGRSQDHRGQDRRSERYAELDHHYGATTLRKQHVRVTRDGIMFDYVAKAGKRRTIVISDGLVVPTRGRTTSASQSGTTTALTAAARVQLIAVRRTPSHPGPERTGIPPQSLSCSPGLPGRPQEYAIPRQALPAHPG
jgi:hypothetical protein